MVSKSKQLIFQWNKANKSRFDDFYFDSLNEKVKDSLINSGDIYLYGLNKTGKTYLLQSLCNYYSNEGKTSLFIPLKDVKKLGSEIMDSLEDLDLICLDDIDLIAGDRRWEIAIFNLINKFSISFQSRLGRDPWTTPNTEDEFARLAKEGKKRLELWLEF